jgi:hypothetical protein
MAYTDSPALPASGFGHSVAVQLQQRVGLQPPQTSLLMTTPLDKTLRRQIRIQGQDYVVALSPDGLKSP